MKDALHFVDMMMMGEIFISWQKCHAPPCTRGAPALFSRFRAMLMKMMLAFRLPTPTHAMYPRLSLEPDMSRYTRHISGQPSRRARADGVLSRATGRPRRCWCACSRQEARCHFLMHVPRYFLPPRTSYPCASRRAIGREYRAISRARGADDAAARMLRGRYERRAD